MTAANKKLQWNGAEPEVDQGNFLGFALSWNPDDTMFYVATEGKTPERFSEWRSTLAFCRCKDTQSRSKK